MFDWHGGGDIHYLSHCLTLVVVIAFPVAPTRLHDNTIRVHGASSFCIIERMTAFYEASLNVLFFGVVMRYPACRSFPRRIRLPCLKDHTTCFELPPQ